MFLFWDSLVFCSQCEGKILLTKNKSNRRVILTQKHLQAQIFQISMVPILLIGQDAPPGFQFINFNSPTPKSMMITS